MKIFITIVLIIWIAALADSQTPLKLNDPTDCAFRDYYNDFVQNVEKTLCHYNFTTRNDVSANAECVRRGMILSYPMTRTRNPVTSQEYDTSNFLNRNRNKITFRFWTRRLVSGIYYCATIDADFTIYASSPCGAWPATFFCEYRNPKDFCKVLYVDSAAENVKYKNNCYRTNLMNKAAAFDYCQARGMLLNSNTKATADFEKFVLDNSKNITLPLLAYATKDGNCQYLTDITKTPLVYQTLPCTTVASIICMYPDI